MRRVAVTGMGIVSCLGNSKTQVENALREGRSGIRYMQEYADLGLRSQLAGRPDIDLESTIDRKLKRFMGTRPPTRTSPCAMLFKMPG